MSTYRPKGRPFYHYDFDIKGHRFHGTTKRTSKREADLFEREARKEALKEVEEREASGRGLMTFGVASTRYWTEIGENSANRAGVEWSLAWLQREIGSGMKLVDIDGSVAARLVAARRRETVKRNNVQVPVSNATVNRTVTEVLRRILFRAAKVWGERTAVIHWKSLTLKEPNERVRELRADEEKTMFAAMPADYHAILEFALMTGCRLRECVDLRWSAVDWGGRQIWVLGKGNKLEPIPLPPTLRDLLWPLQGHHEESVFTYVAAVTRFEGVRDPRNRTKGVRYPISYEGLKTAFRRHAKSRIFNYKFHDNRHTAATRLLRSTGNIRLVQTLLRHTDIKTTTKYAHVMNDDVLNAMETVAASKRQAVAKAETIKKSDAV